MTTDWWSTQTANTTEMPKREDIPPAPQPVPPPSPAPTPEPATAAEEPSSSARGKAVKVMSGVAGALIIGALALSATSGGGEGGQDSSVTASAESGDLPPAGGGVESSDLPAAGAGPDSPPQQADAPEQTSGGVTLGVDPSGRGRIGAVVNVTISNETGKPLMVMATLVQGDGRPAVVGEGTLAPGSRTVQPGETVSGTVEFAANAAPRQVALLDLSGNVVAANN